MLNIVNKDKFIQAKTFKTAVCQLSKLVQQSDGDVFFIDDVLSNIDAYRKVYLDAYNQFLKPYEKPDGGLIHDNGNTYPATGLSSLGYAPYSAWQNFENAINGSKSNSPEFKSRTYFTGDEYYDYWYDVLSGSFFRINIQLLDDGRAYIDCGYAEEIKE